MYLILWVFLVSLFLLLNLTPCLTNYAHCVDNSNCNYNGVCRNQTCICNDGWQGVNCQSCGGKVRLTAPYGTIYDGFGNYSIAFKCNWLIHAPNSSIVLHLEEFDTECGWDRLYIYDGDSVESPLLAVFTGLMYKNNYNVRRVPEVIAHSGSALMYFFSDDALSMSGFNLTYRLNGCPSIKSDLICSDNGACIDSVCKCNTGWVGAACNIPICPDDCYTDEQHGYCNLEQGRCECKIPWSGSNCGQEKSKGTWIAIQPQSSIPPGSASASAIVSKNTLYIIAGETYGQSKSSIFIYDFNGNVWETPQLEGENPEERYGHSSVHYKNKIYIYGGICGNRGATNELWAFRISAGIWNKVSVKQGTCYTNSPFCGPLHVAGHTATVVASENKKMNRMVVIFGYSPQFGYLNTVQEYYFKTRKWRIVQTQGFPVKGGYGHSSAYDSFSQKIYVYGGLTSEGESANVIMSNLYSYDPHINVWTFLSNAPSARFLHSATFINPALMVVFGGNTYTDNSDMSKAQCYSKDFLVYDVMCDSWQYIDNPQDIQADLARYGHSAVTFKGSLYLYGGFDGQMLSDMLKYTPGNCSAFRSEAECLNNRPGIKCIWFKSNSNCISASDVPHEYLTSNKGEYVKCPEDNQINPERCSHLTDCTSCVQTAWKCKWCDTYCSKEYCPIINGSIKPITNYKQCPSDYNSSCRTLHTCRSCSSSSICHWSSESHCITRKNPFDIKEYVACPTVCAQLTSCSICTQENCIWCQNERKCIDRNAYTVSFPYGQCRDWTTLSERCRSSKDQSQCSSYVTCSQCRDDPACGWCDDGSGTGLGTCVAGGFQGPNLQSLPSSMCPSERWHFTDCPMCQCNGYSTCNSTVNTCIQPCTNNTVGVQCERCRDGFWGSPMNGGKCKPCECNGHATKCHHDNGKCYCTTKGLIGDHCEKCDTVNHYVGNPLIGNKLCFYEVIQDYQFTFNLSKKTDQHFTRINYRNSPENPDIDVDLALKCSVSAKMNITVKTANNPEERILFAGQNCSNFRSRFKKEEFTFGMEDNITKTTFFIYVYDFKSPLWIVISFSQYPKLNLNFLPWYLSSLIF